MYYEEVEKMDDDKAYDYDWEIIDGQERYRWYKYALNSVHEIAEHDAHHDIDNQDFSDFKIYFDCVEWVTTHDPEALVYIMGTLTKPVTQIVKDKLIYHLSKLGYYKASAIVKEYLASYPVPPERTFERKRAKAKKEVEENIVREYRANSEQLYKFKTGDKYKLYNENLFDALGVMLNVWGYSKDKMLKSLPSLEWLFKNSLEDLKELFSLTLCKETKDKFLEVLAEKELYKLHTFMKDFIKTHTMNFYYNIPPYNPNMKGRLQMPDFLGDDDVDL